MSEEARTFDLTGVRADGWLEELAAGSPGFAQLAEVVGERFVAFSVIAGVRITSLTVNPQAIDHSVVEFTVGDDADTQSLALSDFRDSLVHALGGEEVVPETLSEEPSPEELQAYLGFRTVLLAPVFGVSLLALTLDEGGDSVRLTDQAGDKDVPLGELRSALRGLVEAEGEAARAPAPFSIDLGIVAQAREASAQGDRDEVLRLLNAWPGPLSMLLRTAEGQDLEPTVKSALAEALGMLGSAYVELGRDDWGLEVLRLGIQWGQDQDDVSAVLFRRLAEAYLAQERPGEAIGLFRRSLSLGAAEVTVLPGLARAFLGRERALPARLLVDAGVAAGVAEDELAEVREQAEEVLGEAWTRFRELRDAPPAAD